jgi:hypothetical protein
MLLENFTEKLTLAELANVRKIIDDEIAKSIKVLSPKLEAYESFFNRPTIKLTTSHALYGRSELKGTVNIPFLQKPFEAECVVATDALINDKGIKLYCIKEIKEDLGRQIIDCFAIEE